MKQSKFSETANGNYFIDRFEVDCTAGNVIGQSGPNGTIRKGVDQEKVISIDHGALRIEPLIQEGWGRAGIIYGPYRRENGLTFAVSILNGHNTSQAGSLDMSFRHRMKDWVKGSLTWPIQTRAVQWLRYRRKGRTFRMWRRWWKIDRNHQSNRTPLLDENLAIGWFSNEIPQDPRKEGNAFIVHATGQENGELWMRVAEETPPIIRGLQNVPLYYIIILREKGAAYYAATAGDISSLPDYPQMRPLGIDVFNQSETVYAGLFQSVSGQIGFRADTLVREIQVAKPESLSNWYGTAHTFDHLSGDGPLEGTVSDSGLTWMVPKGMFWRTAMGCSPTSADSMAILAARSPTGLLHVLVRPQGDFIGNFSLIWRYQDQDDFWAWKISKSTSQLQITYHGETTVLAVDTHTALDSRVTHNFQILDDGSLIQLYLDGKRVCFNNQQDDRLQPYGGVGFAIDGSTNSSLLIDSIEVHPRLLPVPDEILLKPVWRPQHHTTLVAQDCFDGPPGELAGRLLTIGDVQWERKIGQGVIDLTGHGFAKVRASVQTPNPGRTAFTIPWQYPTNASLELDFIPPGASRGYGEKSRVGFIFYQDTDNYITASTWLDDHYGAASYSVFFHLNGFEEVYDAVWANIGQAIYFGQPCNARMVFEEGNLAVYIDNEAVLFRSLKDVYPDFDDFLVQQVGIVVNWEWGNDTGSSLLKFKASRSQ